MKWLFFLLLAANIAVAGIIGFSSGQKPAALPPSLNADKIRIVEELPPLPAKPAAACYQWGPFAAKDAGAISAALDKLSLGDKLEKKLVSEANGFWTYLPPAKSKLDADKKIRELDGLGIKDHFLIQEGKWRWAISLGMFKTEEAAKHQAAELKAKGEKAAIAGPRDETLKSASFALKNLDEATARQIDALARDYPQVPLQKSACTPPPTDAKR